MKGKNAEPAAPLRSNWFTDPDCTDQTIEIPSFGEPPALSECKQMVRSLQLPAEHFRLIVLICMHIAICCISLICVAMIYSEFYIFYRPKELFGAVVVILSFAVVSLLFAFARISFGYFVGFYFYTMILGYLWLNHFSEYSYNHELTGLSAATSAVAFLLPALFIRSPVRQIWIPSPKAFERFLSFILLLAAATVVLGASYNFRFVAFDDIYSFRNTLKLPTILDYLIEITSNVLSPFAFACFVERKYFWRAGAVLFLLLFLYPITLSKFALFTPAWLVIMVLLSRIFEARIAVIVSLLVPMVVGVILFVLFRNGAIPYEAAIPYFGLINFRMITIPSLAMEYYNYFFSAHDLTYFCQIRLLKPFVSCPYQEPLAIVIYNAFQIGGNFNASLFATEGIASVGPLFAPFSALACGLVIGFGNRLSAGLPPSFILISAAVLGQIFLNIPFTTAMLSHGVGILFLLWYLTPRPTVERGRSVDLRPIQPLPNRPELS